MLAAKVFYKTRFGCIYNADSLEYMSDLKDGQIKSYYDITTFWISTQKKTMVNVDADQYLDWFRPFAKQFNRILANDGSLVIDIGGSWIPGQPTRITLSL